MSQETPEDRDIGAPFPTSEFWEELVERWEEFRADDALGDDYGARIFAIEAALKKGLLAKEAAHSIVRKEQIAQLLEPLRLRDSDPVVDQLWTLAGRHLRPQHRKLLGSDPAASRSQIAALLRSVIALEEALNRLPPVTINFLQQCHSLLPRPLRSREAIDLGDLDLVLTDIGHVAYFAGLTLERERKQPPKLMRARTLQEAARIIEQSTGTEIAHSWSRADQKRFVFRGEAGRALRNYMKLVEPKASERSLVVTLITLRKDSAPA